MKKVLLILLTLAVILTSCTKEVIVTETITQYIDRIVEVEVEVVDEARILELEAIISQLQEDLAASYTQEDIDRLESSILYNKHRLILTTLKFVGADGGRPFTRGRSITRFNSATSGKFYQTENFDNVSWSGSVIPVDIVRFNQGSMYSDDWDLEMYYETGTDNLVRAIASDGYEFNIEEPTERSGAVSNDDKIYLDIYYYFID